MEASFATLNDIQRIEILNNVYQKGVSTPVEDLAFSADKLVYLKPFISRLSDMEDVDNLSSRLMIRQMVDELLSDIIDELAVSQSRQTAAKTDKVIAEYGLNCFFGKNEHANKLRQVA